MQEYFYTLADRLDRLLGEGEVCLSSFKAEDSDFVRLNHAQIRQAGHVTQRQLGLKLVRGQRHANANLSLSGELETDLAGVGRALESLRAQLPYLPEDPYLLYADTVNSSSDCGENRLPAADATLDAVLDAAQGLDLVGLYASGGMYRGFANSLGQRNWHSRYSFNFDWSLYHQRDKAVKSAYAGFVWEETEFQAKLASARRQLEAIKQPARNLETGAYRVYLAPAALAEVFSLLNEDGFSLKAQRSKTSSLLRMLEQPAQTLSPRVTLRENTAAGVAPGFQDAGYLRPPQVTLIEQGHYRDALVSPRSAREFGVPTNGGHSGESALSLDLAPGDLAQDQVLQTLGNGVYINNLWYLNYSDHSACRLTGMTRFATFWVENGEVVAPLNVMRFDETLYSMLGNRLLGLTRERDFIPDAGTYEHRSSHSMRLPGALVDDFHFTL